MRLTHDEMKRLIGPYAVRELPPQAIPGIREHLGRCEECAREAEAVSILLAELNSSQPVEPPSGFSSRVIASARHRISVRTRALALGVALIVVLGAVAGWASWRTSALDGRIERYQQALGSVLGSEDGFALDGSDRKLAARVMVGPDGPQLVAVGLPRLPDDKTYQLWLTNDQKTVSAALFKATDEVSVIEIGRSIDGFDRALVTEEPLGGSPKPTGQPIVGSQT
ncbi:MAG: anti-sigma factor [Actinomycetota bacterium]|nr:anti-sigma factor [Actinomycetota bacterium]